MFVEGIEYQRYKNSDWEKGWLVGEDEYSANSVFLDEKYQPIPASESGRCIWDYRYDFGRGIKISLDN